MCKIYSVFFVCCVFLLLISCKAKKPENDLVQIKERGELRIITLNSSTSYFIYKEEPMGYDYDLAQDFCTQNGLKLTVKVAENVTRLLEMLRNGEGDVIAYPLPIINEWKDSVSYCGSEQIAHQVLVQQANKGDTILQDVTELLGKEVYVKKETKFYQRLVNLNDELGGGILIREIQKDTISSEDLIEMVSQGKIRYTISDEYIAKLNKTYFPNIDIRLNVSGDQRASWAVGKDSPLLAQAINAWASQKGNAQAYKSITKKYFELSKQPFDGEYEIPKGLAKGAISLYDDLFKKHAQGTAYDWHLLAAISYHESRFVNNLTSWAGAAGIMGLMPRTAKSLGLSSSERMNPDLSIKAGVVLLERLSAIFRGVPDKSERLKFILAAYNGGNGHINDAQALASKYGANPYLWEENVKKYIELKKHPEYYNDPVCKNGYFRAGETIKYVDAVLATSERFRKKKQGR